MSILNIKDDSSIYSTYIRTILEENINISNIEKITSVVLKVFDVDNTVTRTVIVNPWGRKNLTVTVMFDVFISRIDLNDEGTIGVKLLINNETITKFKIVTLHFEFTKEKIVEEIKQTLQDIFS